MSQFSQKASPGWFLAAILLILWAFLIMGGYFWAHRPFDAGLVRTVASIVTWLVITWLATALGRRVLSLPLLGNILDEEWPFVRLALAAGIGLGILSLFLLGLGLVGLFYSWAAGLLLLALLVLFWRDGLTVLHQVRLLQLPRAENKLQQWFRFYAVASLLLAFLAALAPPTAWDSLAYHLAGPELFIEAGRIVHTVDIPHLGFPLLGQMQFALGMLLVGDGPAALFHFGYGLLALALTVALARRVAGVEAAWFAAVLLLSVPTLLTLMSWPYVDLALLFYATLAFYAFVRWRDAFLGEKETGETGWLFVLGMACGFAGSVKYTAVVVPMALALSISWIVWRQGLLAIVRRLLPVALMALLLVTPYLLENWLTTGNPVYPFFFDDALFWNEWRAWWYDRPGTGLLATAAWRLPLVPLEMTIAGTQGTVFYEATVGPLLLLSSTLLLVVWRGMERETRALLGHMLLFFVLNYLLWLNGVARTALLLRARFLFFVFGVVAVLGGVALAHLPTFRRPQLDVNWIVRVVVVLSLGLILFGKVLEFTEMNPLPVAAGLETPDDYRSRRLGLYVPALETVNQLPAGSKVEFLWEPRSYGCRVECWPDLNLDRFLHYTQYYEFDAGELAGYWQEEGYTHVLLYQGGLTHVWENRREMDGFTRADLAVLEELQERYLSPVGEWRDSYTLYKVRSS